MRTNRVRCWHWGGRNNGDTCVLLTRISILINYSCVFCILPASGGKNNTYAYLRIFRKIEMRNLADMSS